MFLEILQTIPHTLDDPGAVVVALVAAVSAT